MKHLEFGKNLYFQGSEFLMTFFSANAFNVLTRYLFSPTFHLGSSNISFENLTIPLPPSLPKSTKCIFRLSFVKSKQHFLTMIIKECCSNITVNLCTF